MTRRDKECMYWKRDKTWYRIDYERDHYVLTDKAPEEARRSFELWKKVNGLKWDEELDDD